MTLSGVHFIKLQFRKCIGTIGWFFVCLHATRWAINCARVILFNGRLLRLLKTHLVLLFYNFFINRRLTFKILILLCNISNMFCWFLI